MPIAGLFAIEATSTSDLHDPTEGGKGQLSDVSTSEKQGLYTCIRVSMTAAHTIKNYLGREGVCPVRSPCQLWPHHSGHHGERRRGWEGLMEEAGGKAQDGYELGSYQWEVTGKYSRQRRWFLTANQG